MDAALIGALAGCVTIGLPVVSYLMRVEHRMTRVEALLEAIKASQA
jgi:hypothetical protein